MNNKINYEIDNCTTDLDTLIALDKRAIRDLENNTHEIEHHEVLTIIREFIRLRNDYKQEKEKNNNLIKQLQEQNTEIQDISRQLRQEKEKNKELEKQNQFQKKQLNDAFNRGWIHKDKIKDMMKYREFELQQEYKEFEEDVEWRTYKKILEGK